MEPSLQMRPPEPGRSDGRSERGDSDCEGAGSMSGQYDAGDERATIFSMEDIGYEEEAGGPDGDQSSGPGAASGGRDASDDRDDVFTSSTGSAASAYDGRRRFSAAGLGQYVPAAPLPISGAAYHFRARQAWLSMSAPHSAGFYLGPTPSADRHDSELGGDETTASGGVAAAAQGADRSSIRSRQPLPDLVPRTTEAFRRRTYSESSVSVFAVREFATELRRISDVFEDEVREQRAAVVSATVVTTRHEHTLTRRIGGHRDDAAPGDGSPADAGRPVTKRRSSSFLQDLKDFLSKTNSPSSL